MITVVSNYFFAGTNIDRYVAVIGGASLVLTAIIHPEGIAPFFQRLFQHFGRWLLRARGAEWAAVGKRLGPVALLGAVAGYLDLAGAGRQLQQVLDAAARGVPGPVHPLDRHADHPRPPRRADRTRRPRAPADRPFPSPRWSDMALLETHDLTVRYGGLAANDSVNLHVEPGKLVGLIGPNGAGKTTFIDAITGFTAVSTGTVQFDGHELNELSADRRAHLGLARTFQSLELFEDLTRARQPARRRRAAAVVLVPARPVAARRGR